MLTALSKKFTSCLVTSGFPAAGEDIKKNDNRQRVAKHINQFFCFISKPPLVLALLSLLNKLIASPIGY
jgi:hypothetical protein